jgi:hypothetical protein
MLIYIRLGFAIHVEPNTLPGRSDSTSLSQVHFSIPWTWLCCRLQSRTADVQVWRPTLVQRRHQTELWDTVYKYIW